MKIASDKSCKIVTIVFQEVNSFLCHGGVMSCVAALADNVEWLVSFFRVIRLTDKYVNLHPESVSSFS